MLTSYLDLSALEVSLNSSVIKSDTCKMENSVTVVVDRAGSTPQIQVSAYASYLRNDYSQSAGHGRRMWVQICQMISPLIST